MVDRSYTARGELYQLKHAGTTIDTRAYDNGGRMSSSTLNNGVVDTRAYGADSTLSSITFTGSGTSIGNLSYAWDNNHNKTSETITGTMSNYGFSIPTGGYDSEDRLVSFNRTSGLSQSWSLSAVGDWNSVTTNGTAQARTHGPTHELLTGAGSNVSTDVKGNITLIPASLRPNASSLTSTWDFDNRLASATTGSTTVSHQYDALGRRVSRTSGSSTTVYVQAGQQTIADYASGAAPASSTYRYVYASYIDEPVMRWTTSSSTAVYYHRNQQYSVTALTDSSGSVLERYAYTAYGVPTIANSSGGVLSSSAQNNRYTYTGREWDNDIQQYHYRARMYDQALGRFCSRDPIGFKDGFGLYNQYAGTSSTDPSGMELYIEPFKIPHPNSPNESFQSYALSLLNQLCPDGKFQIDPKTNKVTSSVAGFCDGPKYKWVWHWYCGDIPRREIDVPAQYSISKFPLSCKCLCDAINSTSSIWIEPYGTQPMWPHAYIWWQGGLAKEYPEYWACKIGKNQKEPYSGNPVAPYIPYITIAHEICGHIVPLAFNDDACKTENCIRKEHNEVGCRDGEDHPDQSGR